MATNRAESEESDEEDGTGNVTRMVMRPPGHSGKAKKGHLCLDASFETGNLGRVDYISEFEYDLYIRSDSCNPRHRFWFNFTIDNVRLDQRVILNIVNFSRESTLLSAGLTPLIKSITRPHWERMPTTQVFYHQSPHHGNRYILSLALNFDVEEDVYQLALTYPYSFSRLQFYLDLVDEHFSSIVHRETIGNSIQNRPVDLLTITNQATDCDEEAKPTRKKTVFVICRSHPGESPASYVCQGLIDFLVSSEPIARALREFVEFKIIPMINPDGVFNGNERSSMVGADLNRVWNDYSEFFHPTVKAAMDAIRHLDEQPDSNLEFILDLHAHHSLLGTFLYGNSYDDFLRFERHLLFGKIYSQTVEDFCMGNCMYNKDNLKAGTARRYLSHAVKEHVNVYSFFISMMGFQLPNSTDIHLYDEEGYQRAGRNLARALFEYYKIVGHIPASYIQSLQPAPGRKKTKYEVASTYRNFRSEGKQIVNRIDGKEGDEGDGSAFASYRRANRLILEIEPCFAQNPSFRPFLRKPVTIQVKDSMDSRSTTPLSNGQSSSSGGNSDPKVPSIPSLSVIDFSSLTMSRKELRQLHRRNSPSI
ncbi:cytosolic carboxypeptidase 6 isoform X2 [Daphnia magna]|uniref:cytosolic carboxypeptidase 6 isoform X2 n=1 Tax=Daphnia magna TaxID=35525 RepID=UPI001E1BC415|nr:cytosolic carboxypeptidase 6 isoform X2 [Daphnia magna]